ncbi:MAG TPA: fibronectin type III domain-containing protein [Thermoanaerobaculia bacterium]|nr:fibronectin type III domain-containing protein [Thermoanaerobaculia bacterium]
MKSHVKRTTGAAVCLGALLLALPVLGQQVKEDPARLRLEAASAAKAGKAAEFEINPELTTKTHVCDHFGSISCGQTVSGTLTAQDCQLADDSRIDFWEFQGTSGQTVTVTMTSNQVDSYLFLLNPQSQTAAQNDDGAGGSNARVVYPLNGSGAWAIGANASPNQTGDYSITLACSGTGGGVGTPAAPSALVATAASTTEIDLDWQDRSANETGFVIQGRSAGQAFQDLGAVGANSTGATITNLTPGTAYTFRVRARNANGDSPYSNEATATTLGGDGSGGFLTSASFPDFRFRVRITPQGAATIQGRKENTCIPETLCVSGAAAGRSEVFIRIVGPRPNGFLWPTIVRFTPSQVEVDVQQISTGIQKTYFLPAVPPGSDDLSGLQDRTGFQP